MLELVLLVVGAYLLGSVPSAYLAAKWSKGVDIRRYGTGNVGASNIGAIISKRLVVPVILFDVAKGLGPVWAAQLLGMGAIQQGMVGLAAICGHNWSVYLGFTGGRGVATTLGVVGALAPYPTAIALALALFLGLFRQLGLGTIIALIVLPLLSWFFGDRLGVSEPRPVTLGLLAFLLLAVFRRLTAPRSPFTGEVPRGELWLNRFLFDRDIRDRETWLRRTMPPREPEKEGKE